ncbi:MAG: hypothetical protein Q8Q08_07660 [Candidatus Omnitrophota bacterium]|nr:hypothetical protein [Candidatus Omnitrophota bacterium]MDZ4242320.1 hypothetical protein [Candidatus Omnitrophota bacterium]
MSIINDALKKVQNNLQSNGAGPEKVLPIPQAAPALQAASVPPAAAVRVPPPKPEKIRQAAETVITPQTVADKSAGKKEGLIIGICVLICAVLVFLIIYLVGEYNRSRTWMGKAGSPHRIVIKGIMAMGDRNVLLINDEVYEVGDSVQGKKIVKISLDRVEFLDRGRVRTFRVSKKSKDQF